MTNAERKPIYEAMDLCRFGAYVHLGFRNGIRTLLADIDSSRFQMTNLSDPGKTVWETFADISPDEQEALAKKVWSNE